MRRVGWSAVARHDARFTAEVVFPTPPFWFAIAIIRAKNSPDPRKFSKGLKRKQDVSRGTFWTCGRNGTWECSTWNIFHSELQSVWVLGGTGGAVTFHVEHLPDTKK